jgi:phage tail-like protein
MLTCLLLTAIVPLASAQRLHAAGGKDPLSNVHVVVDIEGQPWGYFLTFEGLGSRNAVHRGEPGPLSFDHVHLVRGLTASRDVWDWRLQVVSGHIAQARHQVTIRLVDAELHELMRWELARAWPVEVRVAVRTEQSSGGEVLRLPYEELILAYENVALVNPPPTP